MLIVVYNLITYIQNEAAVCLEDTVDFFCFWNEPVNIFVWGNCPVNITIISLIRIWR